MADLNIYYIETIAPVIVAEGEDQYGYCCLTEDQTVGHLVATVSRSKARQWICKEYKIDDYIHPMSIRKVKHQLSQDDILEGELSCDWSIDDNLMLRHYSEIEAMLSQYQHEQEMLAVIYEGES